MSDDLNTMDLLIALRGGLPDKCDFCEQPYNDERQPQPEEAGMWTCTECVNRWAVEDRADRERLK